MNGEKHHSHKYEELNEAFERYKKGILSQLEPVVKQLTATKEALVLLDVNCDKISDQKLTVETDINDTFMRLHKMLDARKTELIGQLHQLTQAKLKSLAVQRDQIETIQTLLSSCLLFMRDKLETGNQVEVLLTKSATVRQVKELTTTFQPGMLEPITEADMIFSQLSDLSAECKNYGQVYAENSLDPSKCYITGKDIDTARPGEKSSIVLQTFNFNNKPLKAHTTSISCELVSEIAGTGTKGSIERKGENQFEIIYQPTIKGRHQLHIQVEGQHIKGSPFPISVILPVEKLGTPIQSIHGIRRPEGVAVNKRGEVVVIDGDEHSVSVFSPNGERLQSFGKRGSGPGQFNYPLDVAVDAEENILVADYYNHRIQKFTAQGEFLKAVGTRGNGPLQFENPCGIVFNPINGRVYVGNQNGRVQILDSDLGYHGTMEKKGHPPKDQLHSVQRLACDSNGNVYAVDRLNYNIQIFSAEGKFLRMFGGRGEGRGKLNNPDGIAIDSRDRVYVSELRYHCVSVFTSEGQYVTSIGSEGEGPGQFKYPHGIAVDNSGVVYVCDRGNMRVQLF